MIKDSPNPPAHPGHASSRLHQAAYRAIDHYLPPTQPNPTTIEPRFDRLFSVSADAGTETLLVNAAQDLASINVMATNLAFEIDGAPRSVALGMCRLLEGVQMLVDNALDACDRPASR